LDYSKWTFEPNNNFRVDFGFWTGTKLIAVEIDGNEPEGYARDIRRDRLLRRADVDVVHILNTEIDKHGGENLMVALLPQSIAFDWTKAPVPEGPPS
jgi:very-short-patch-repair endonuclease